MSIVKNIELENQIYDIHGKNVQHISWQDYQNLEDKSGDIAYFIEDAPSQKAEGFLSDLPAGSISTVTDAAELPLNALKVSVEAWQEGSGDPSPSNIRPIHGWDSGEIGVKGKNLLPLTVNGIKTSNSGATWVGNSTTINGVAFTILTDESRKVTGISIDGTATSAITFNILFSTILTLPPSSYTYSGNDAFNNDFRYRCNDGSFFAVQKNDVTRSYANGLNLGLAQVIIESGYTVDDVTITPMIRFASDADATFQPYNPDSRTYTLNFPTTIYGAEWDVVGGKLKQTDGYIASYNGESLPSSWISDRDEYASGTTPTIGAEVVYKLDTPTTIDLSPLSIRMLEGTNNLYADCGEVIEGEYWAEQSSAQIRMNDEVIAGDATQYAVQSEFAKKADNACTFTVDEDQELLIINWVNQS